MSGDISDSAKVGIGVLLLCFLIGIVFNVFTMVRSTATKGTNQLQGSMNQMVDATYASYDNETVFGTAVLNAIATYGQDKMCLVVDNRVPSGGVGSLNLPNPPAATSIKAPVKAADGTYNVTLNSNNYPYYYGYPLSSFEGSPKATDTSFVATLNVTGSRSLETAPTKQLGSTGVYVNTMNRYSAKIIRDTTDQIIGIYFQLQP